MEASHSIYLHPGQLAACARPTAIRTIVGSCVAVCIWDPTSQVGGMNHFLLPHSTTAAASAGRFGRPATETLVRRALDLGASKKTLVAKVFGGACVLDAFRSRERHLGQQNVAIALEVLRELNVRIVFKDVGGDLGRRITLSTSDGTVTVKLV